MGLKAHATSLTVVVATICNSPKKQILQNQQRSFGLRG